jgi:hypothetical protein
LTRSARPDEIAGQANLADLIGFVQMAAMTIRTPFESSGFF